MYKFGGHHMIVRRDQLQVLEQKADARFDQLLHQHLRKVTAGQPGTEHDTAISTLVAQVRQAATAYGLSTRGGMQLIGELMCLLGSGFATDPMISLMPALLAQPSPDPIDRADELHVSATEYLEAVAGPRDSNLIRALERMTHFIPSVVSLSLQSGEGEMANRLHSLFPEKCARCGPAGTRALLRRAEAIANQESMHEVPDRMRIAAALTLFGHEALNDPLHSRLATMLQNSRPDEFIRYCFRWTAYLGECAEHG